MNKTNIIGRLTATPTLNHTLAGMPVTNFTLAVTRRVKPEVQSCDFIPIVAWSKAAEFAAKHFTKGMQVGLTGHISTRTQETDGVKRTLFEVVAEELYFADGKREDKPVVPDDLVEDDEDAIALEKANNANFGF